MPLQRCLHPACRRPFLVSQFKTDASDGSVLGKIVCPYCWASFDGDRDSIFLTHALSAEQEHRFNREHPGGR